MKRPASRDLPRPAPTRQSFQAHATGASPAKLTFPPTDTKITVEGALSPEAVDDLCERLANEEIACLDLHAVTLPPGAWSQLFTAMQGRLPELEIHSAEDQDDRACIEALAALVQARCPGKLTLENVYAGNIGVLNAALRGLQPGDALQDLTWMGAGYPTLAASSSVERLAYVCAGNAEDLLDFLENVVEPSETLRSLSLEAGPFAVWDDDDETTTDEVGAKECERCLAQMLGANTSLTSLRVSMDFGDDAAARQLADAIEKHPALTTFRHAGAIGKDQCKLLVGAIARNRSIVDADIAQGDDKRAMRLRHVTGQHKLMGSMVGGAARGLGEWTQLPGLADVLGEFAARPENQQEWSQLVLLSQATRQGARELTSSDASVGIRNLLRRGAFADARADHARWGALLLEQDAAAVAQAAYEVAAARRQVLAGEVAQADAAWERFLRELGPFAEAAVRHASASGLPWPPA